MKFSSVICFEPNPVAASLLINNVKINGLEDVICLDYLGLALSDRDFDSGFVLPYSHNLGAGRLGEIESSDVRVKVVHSGNALVGIQNISLIKIDVEGNELQVLDGLVEIIKQQMPDMFIEVVDAGFGQFEEFCSTVDYEIVRTFQTYQYLKNYHVRPRRRHNS